MPFILAFPRGEVFCPSVLLHLSLLYPKDLQSIAKPRQIKKEENLNHRHYINRSKYLIQARLHIMLPNRPSMNEEMREIKKFWKTKENKTNCIL